MFPHGRFDAVITPGVGSYLDTANVLATLFAQPFVDITDTLPDIGVLNVTVIPVVPCPPADIVPPDGTVQVYPAEPVTAAIE